MTDTRRRLGETLIQAGVLTQEQLDAVLDIQSKRQLRLGTILLQERLVTEPQLVQALSRQLSIPWVSLWHIDVPDALLEFVPLSLAEEFFLIPIYVRSSPNGERTLYVAMNDPMDDDALRLVAASAGMNVRPMIAGPSDIAAAIQAYYVGDETEEAVAEQAAGPRNAPSVPPPVPKVPPTPRNSPPTNQATPGPGPAEETIRPAVEDAAPRQETAPKDPSANSAGPTIEERAELSDEDKKKRVQREAEKHMFGVGNPTKSRRLSLTLLDGTTIQFGAEAGKNEQGVFTKDQLIAGLRAAAGGTPLDDFLPSTAWQSYMAALLEVLFRKHLVLFDEFYEELQKGSS